MINDSQNKPVDIFALYGVYQDKVESILKDNNACLILIKSQKETNVSFEGEYIFYSSSRQISKTFCYRVLEKPIDATPVNVYNYFKEYYDKVTMEETLLFMIKKFKIFCDNNSGRVTIDNKLI